MLDVGGLPAGAAPAAADFVLETGDGTTWTPLGVAHAVSLRRGAGSSGTDRVTLILPDGAARNTWLRVTALPGTRTGLASNDVFHFGNLVGDTGNDSAAPTVDVRDLAATLRNFGRTTAAALAASDFNRDGKVDAADVTIARSNLQHALPLFTAPAAPAAASSARFADTLITTRTTRPPRRGLLDEPQHALPA